VQACIAANHHGVDIKRACMYDDDMTKPMKKTLNVFIKPQKSEKKHLDTAKSAKCQTPNRLLSISYQDLRKIL